MCVCIYILVKETINTTMPDYNLDAVVKYAIDRKYGNCTDDNVNAETHKYLKHINAHKAIFKRAKYDKFVSFHHTESDAGIPYFAKLFKTFDPINTREDFSKYIEYRDFCDFNYNDVMHLLDYLQADEFNSNLLRTRSTDHIATAIISFMLQFDDIDLEQFGLKYEKFSALCQYIIQERAVDNYNYLYLYNNYVPFIKTSFKILNKFFKPENALTKAPSVFNLLRLINRGIVNELNYYFQLHQTNGFTLDIVKQMESHRNLYFTLDNIDLDAIRGTSNFKFISGEACCGKTTIANFLKSNGWQIYSRGDCGSFSGKATNPAAVGCLHSALDYVLTQPNVIGDRGYIDNILWVFIMYACAMKNIDTLVIEMLKFFNANFNAPAIANFCSQKGVIFLDPYPDKNKERMLNRNTDGDAHRARIEHYQVAQFMTYLFAALLFGWKIICVPYTSEREFNPSGYDEKVRRISEYFGETGVNVNTEFVRYAKPPNDYDIDSSFAKSIGIFK